MTQIQAILKNGRTSYWKKEAGEKPKRIKNSEYWKLYDESFHKPNEIEVLPPITKE